MKQNDCSRTNGQYNDDYIIVQLRAASLYVIGSALIAAHLTGASDRRKLPLMIASLMSMGASLWLRYAVIIRNPFLTVSASTNLAIYGLTLSKILRRGMRPEIQPQDRT